MFQYINATQFSMDLVWVFGHCMNMEVTKVLLLIVYIYTVSQDDCVDELSNHNKLFSLLQIYILYKEK